MTITIRGQILAALRNNPGLNSARIASMIGMTTKKISGPLSTLFADGLIEFEGKHGYRCSHGGRGSAKTRTFALMTAVKAYQSMMNGESGVVLCAREFMNSLEESSMQEVKQAILSVPWLASNFDIGEKYIRTIDKSVNYVFCGLRHTGYVKSNGDWYLLCRKVAAEKPEVIRWEDGNV